MLLDKSSIQMLYTSIETWLSQLKTPADRLELLDRIAQSIESTIRNNQDAQLLFVCTHNSRRSQISQVWAQTLASHLGLPIRCQSAGTESTAFHPNAIQTLKDSGFRMEKQGEENPIYSIQFSDEQPVIRAWSKTLDQLQEFAPPFIAIMTCDEADQNCPIVPGASVRFSLPYVDPKHSDLTDQKTETYAKTSRVIAGEWFYILKQINI